MATMEQAANDKTNEVGEVGMIQIDIPMPESCSQCPCHDYDDIMDECSCNIEPEIWRIPEYIATVKRDERCPLKEVLEPPKEKNE